MKRILAFLMLVMLVVCSSCEQETILIVPQSSVTIDVGGGSVALPFIANKTWVAASDQSWCKVSPTSGDAAEYNDVTLTLSCEPNTTYEDRSCTVTITCMDLTQSIQVTQGKNDGLFLTKNSFDLTNEAQRISVEVKANVDYTYSIDESSKTWITATSTKGLSANVVMFDIAKNEEFDEREGTITFSQKNGLLSEVVTIKQSQRNGLFVSTPEYHLSNEEHLLTVEVKSNVEFTVISQSEWIKPVETKGLQTSQISLAVEANNSFDAREGTVLVQQTNGDLSGVITIKQDEKHGLFVSRNSFDLTSEAQSIDVEVTYDIAFDVIIPDGCKDWISPIDTKAAQSKVFSFAIAKNETYGDRQGYITFKQKDGPISETISVSQSQNDAIILAEKEYQLSGDNQILSFDIQSNVDFRVEIDGDWITRLETKGLDTHTLSFEIKENTEQDLREGTISLISEKVTQTVLIKQSKKQSQVDPHKPSFSEAIELICLVWRLMGAEEYNTCRVPSVYESADSYFASMKNHAAVSLARECRQTRGVAYDAVTSYGLHLVISDQGVISFNPDYLDNIESRWTSQQKIDMLAALNDFYKESKFHEWYLSMEPYRQEALQAFEKTGDIDHDWYNTFFGPIDNLSTQIILSFFIGNNNNGLSLNLVNGSKLLSPVMGCLSQNSSGKISFNDDGSILVHEFSHPYCNPLIDKYWDSIEETASEVFKSVENQMRNQAYGNARTMMCETFVRASTVRYFMNHTSDKKQENRIKNEVNRGFLLVPTLVEVLDKREKEQAQYATMDAFMPEIIKAINGYVPKFSGSGQYEEYTYSSTEKLLPGVFSISATEKVQFTKGNLYWDGSDWKIEDNQMNFPSTWNTNHIGHFYWASTAAAAKAVSFNSSGLSTADHFFCDGSDDAHSLTVEGISGLRVLGDGNDGEINYLLNKRQNARKLYKFPVEIKDVGNCLVIAPDDYTGSILGAYDATSWAEAEAAGLVCLTPAGTRYGSTITVGGGYIGYYWCGTPKADSERHAYMVSFTNTVNRFPSYSSRNNGFSVRLVRGVNINFADAAFKAYCIDSFDKNNDKEVSINEASMVKAIACDNKSIQSLSGIEYFTNLESLSCANNQLKSIDVSHNASLTELKCSGNLLTNLDVSKNKALRVLYCDNNQLTNLDISGNFSLSELKCANNPLASLLLRTGQELSVLIKPDNIVISYKGDPINTIIPIPDVNFKHYCVEKYDSNHDGEISVEEALLVQTIEVNPEVVASLEGIEYFENLRELRCNMDCYTYDIRNYVIEKYKRKVGDEYIEIHSKLSSLDVSQNTELTYLDCRNIALTKLDVSKNTKLTYLDCSANLLESLDVSHNPLLQDFRCDMNRLKVLDVSENKQLSYFLCDWNPLSSLDLSQNQLLTHLICFVTDLTSLDVSSNPRLTQLDCRSNHLLKEIWLKTGQTIANFLYDTDVVSIKYK